MTVAQYAGPLLVYNDVVIQNLELDGFTQQVLKDESQTDFLYNRFEITVSGTITDQFSSNDDGDKVTVYPGRPSIQNTVTRMAKLQALLQTPRRDFYFIIGGQIGATEEQLTLLIATGRRIVENQPGGIGNDKILAHPFQPLSTQLNRVTVLDNENGPYCESVRIKQIYGGKAFRVSATFTVCRLSCDEVGEDDPPVNDPNLKPTTNILSNRWSLDESKDDSWRTTRTLQGTLRTQHSDFFAQFYRHLVIPPLLRGYQRISQSFVSDPTNTVLKYRITDRQTDASPPPPAIKWSGTHTESMTGSGGRAVANISIRLEGPPHVDKLELMTAAGYVLTQRIPDLQKLAKGEGDPRQDKYNTIPQNLSITDHLSEPVIEMNCRVLYVVPEDQYRWLSMRLKNFEPEDPTLGIDGYHPTVHAVPLAYDSPTPAGIFACYLQHPCSVWKGIAGDAYPQDTTRGDNDASGGSYPPDAREYPELKSLEEDTPRTPTDTDNRYAIYDHPYTIYQVSNHYENGLGLLHLPYSVPNADEADATAKAVPIHAGLCRRIMEVEAVRDGREPVVPSLPTTTTDPNGIVETLLHFEVLPRAPELLGDAYSKRYGLYLKAIYGLSRPVTENDKLQAGSTGNDGDTPELNLFDYSENVDVDGRIMPRY